MNYINHDQKLLQEATPLQRVSSKSGPIFMANSLNELVPLSGVYSLQQALSHVNVPSEVKLIEGVQHGEGYSNQAWDSSMAFLAEYLK